MDPAFQDSISATRLSEVGLCQRMVALRMRHGEAEPAPARKSRLEHGVVMHDSTEQAAMGVSRKGPCFIATAVFGSRDPRTELLRTWRDDVLLQNRLGRSFVRAYYRLSPPLAKALSRSRASSRIVARLLEIFLARIVAPSLARTKTP